jgi:hypothetical protein
MSKDLNLIFNHSLANKKNEKEKLAPMVDPGDISFHWLHRSKKRFTVK